MAHEVECLFLQIAWCCTLSFGGSHSPLTFNDALGKVGCADAPYLMEGVHVERQVIQRALIASQGRVDEGRDGGQSAHEVPDTAVVGVKDVGTITMNSDAVDDVTMDIAAKVLSAVYHQATIAVAGGLVCEGGSSES